MTELSAGAWRLYCFLARSRHRDTGKCAPSVAVTMDAIGVNRGTVYALRKELQARQWATFDGDQVVMLFGFKSLKNQTVGAVNAELTPSLKNQTAEKSEKSDCLKNQTVIGENIAVTKSLKNQTRSLVNKSEKSDCLKNQTNFVDTAEDNNSLKNQTRHVYINSINTCINTIESKENNKQKKDMSSSPVSAGQVREVFAYWQFKLNHQRAKLTPEREKAIRARLKDGYTVADLKRGIDGCAASPFHMGTGKDSDGTVYDDIELICRKGSKLESFMNKAPASQSGNGRADPAYPPVVSPPANYRPPKPKDKDDSCDNTT